MTAQNLKELIEGDALTEKEVAILYCTAKGLGYSQTGEELFLSPETVKDYRKRIMAKLGAKNMVHAVVLAIGSGIIDISRLLGDE